MTADIKEKEYLYWLCNVPSFGAVKIKKLWEQFGSFEYIYNIEEKALEKTDYLRREERIILLSHKQFFQEKREEFQSLKEKRIDFVTPLDDHYPNRLREIYDMPMGLFVRGSLPTDHRPSAAIIGARGCSSYGSEAARYLGRELAKSGIQVVSGLAAGIDGKGHQGALEGGGDTYGVLGCGVDICYPREHFNLYLEVEKRGGLISEYPMGTQPLSKNFPIRNRIISGLADVIIVVEARKRSGSLITVGLALEQGKDVFAIPGRITDPLSAGCNELIFSGAFILTSPDQVAEYLGVKKENSVKLAEKKGKGLAMKEKMLYSCLDLQPRHLEEIVNLTGMSVSECMSILLELELRGYVIQISGHYYGKRL